MTVRLILYAIKTILVALALGTMVALAYIATQQNNAQRIELGQQR
jgi:hypothetical protein